MFIFTTQFSLSQGEANIWLFGYDGAGLNFNNDTVIPFEGKWGFGSIEGTSTICDSSGNLLIYNDGSYLYNGELDRIGFAKRLEGGYSITQTLIVKQPLSDSLFYIFTIPEPGLYEGLRYTLVNLKLNSGLGGIPNDFFNLPVTNYQKTTEKVTAIRHANLIDYWIVTHLYDKNEFHAYLLTHDSLSLTPIISETGVDSVAKGGYLKSNIQGNKLATSIRNGVGVYDFDNSNGKISNGQTSTKNDSLGHCYGIEFSPSGCFLYTSNSYIDKQSRKIFQFDLRHSDFKKTLASKATILDETILYSGALQLGPDGKIYHVRYPGNYLGIIKTPENPGKSCNYIAHGIEIKKGTIEIGLPNFPNDYFETPKFKISGFCPDDTTYFILLEQKYDSVKWIIDNSITLTTLSPHYIFESAGTHEI